MRIISRKTLRDFWESRRGDAEIAERDLAAWFKLAENADWPNFAALKQTFESADRVGNCVVFDVGNNRFRVIGRVFFNSRRLYILKVMDHEEYDEQTWPDECGCHEPPPKPPPPSKKSAPKRAEAPRPRKKRG